MNNIEQHQGGDNSLAPIQEQRISGNHPQITNSSSLQEQQEFLRIAQDGGALDSSQVNSIVFSQESRESLFGLNAYKPAKKLESNKHDVLSKYRDNQRLNSLGRILAPNDTRTITQNKPGLTGFCGVEVNLSVKAMNGTFKKLRNGEIILIEQVSNSNVGLRVGNIRTENQLSLSDGTSSNVTNNNLGVQLACSSDSATIENGRVRNSLQDCYMAKGSINNLFSDDQSLRSGMKITWDEQYHVTKSDFGDVHKIQDSFPNVSNYFDSVPVPNCLEKSKKELLALDNEPTHQKDTEKEESKYTVQQEEEEEEEEEEEDSLEEDSEFSKPLPRFDNRYNSDEDDEYHTASNSTPVQSLGGLTTLPKGSINEDPQSSPNLTEKDLSEKVLFETRGIGQKNNKDPHVANFIPVVEDEESEDSEETCNIKFYNSAIIKKDYKGQDIEAEFFNPIINSEIGALYFICRTKAIKEELKTLFNSENYEEFRSDLIKRFVKADKNLKDFPETHFVVDAESNELVPFATFLKSNYSCENPENKNQYKPYIEYAKKDFHATFTLSKYNACNDERVNEVRFCRSLGLSNFHVFAATPHMKALFIEGLDSAHRIKSVVMVHMSLLYRFLDFITTDFALLSILMGLLRLHFIFGSVYRALLSLVWFILFNIADTKIRGPFFDILNGVFYLDLITNFLSIVFSNTFLTNNITTSILSFFLGAKNFMITSIITAFPFVAAVFLSVVAINLFGGFFIDNISFLLEHLFLFLNNDVLGFFNNIGIETVNIPKEIERFDKGEVSFFYMFAKFYYAYSIEKFFLLPIKCLALALRLPIIGLCLIKKIIEENRIF